MATEQITSIDKAFILLEQLAAPPYEYKVAELAKILDMNRTSVYRMLQILMGRDMVIFDSVSDRYKIGPGMYHIGSTYLYNANFEGKIIDTLTEIAEITKESVGMAVWQNGKVISIFETEIHQPMKLNDTPGKYFQYNKGCYGKCLTAYQRPEVIDQVLDGVVFEKTTYNTLTTKEELLAEYAKIRSQGYVEAIDESQNDVLAVGIPLFKSSGEIKACVAVAFYKMDGWEEKMEQCRKVLFRYQEKLEKEFP